MATILLLPPNSPGRELIESAIRGKPITFREGRRYSFFPSLSVSYDKLTVEEGSFTIKMKF